ncbi:hypothetical protein TWF481_010364 [Arthrobotrys musiformis]|uniref:Uncharacterized protein n=1 Tax=Arthrobotrys musiformis TaxID=47236 RepID=A0AAV9W6J5_9PEZI
MEEEFSTAETWIIEAQPHQGENLYTQKIRVRLGLKRLKSAAGQIASLSPLTTSQSGKASLSNTFHRTFSNLYRFLICKIEYCFKWYRYYHTKLISYNWLVQAYGLQSTVEGAGYYLCTSDRSWLLHKNLSSKLNVLS